MKQYLLLLCMILMASFLQAQVRIVGNASVLKEKLNELNLLNGSINPTKKGIQIKQLDSLIVTHNGNGKNAKGKLRSVYTYDKSRNSIVENNYQKLQHNKNWYHNSIHTKTFDGKDNLIERKWVSPESTSYNGSWTQYVFKNNQLIEEITSERIEESWNQVGKKIISYNESGNRAEVLVERPIGRKDQKWIYSYNAGNLVQIQKYKFIDNKEQNYLNTILIYNGNNQLIRVLETFSRICQKGGQAFEEDLKLDITYLPTGKSFEMATRSFIDKDGPWTPEYKLEQSFDSKNNLTSETFYHNRDGLVPFSREHFTYDNTYAYPVLKTFMTELYCRNQLLTYTLEKYNQETKQFEPSHGGVFHWKRIGK